MLQISCVNIDVLICWLCIQIQHRPTYISNSQLQLCILWKLSYEKNWYNFLNSTTKLFKDQDKPYPIQLFLQHLMENGQYVKWFNWKCKFILILSSLQTENTVTSSNMHFIFNLKISFTSKFHIFIFTLYSIFIHIKVIHNLESINYHNSSKLTSILHTQNLVSA